MTDDRLVTLAKAVGKVGIDVPLGWPRRFAEAVWAHSTGSGWPSDCNHAADNDQMRLRATDRWIVRQYQQHALSVAADRLALPAMRAAWLVPRLQVGPVDVSGTGKVVEVYPALALRIWGCRTADTRGPRAHRHGRRSWMHSRTASHGWISASSKRRSSGQ
jgi:hypothetical protein